MSKIANKKNLILVALIIIAVAVIGVVCSIYAGADTSVQTMHIDNLLVQKTQDDLLEESTLIAVANFVSASEPFKIESVDGYLISPTIILLFRMF